MLPVYNPVVGLFQASAGLQPAGGDVTLLNILIELRVMNAIFLDSQRGLVTQSVEQYRSDVVNDITASIAVPQ